MKLRNRIGKHFRKRFEIGLERVDPALIRFEQTRRRPSRGYNLLWFGMMAALIILLFLARQ
jgi:hypothetical protein